MDTDYFQMLFDYNRWANARILDKAAEVSEADYFAPRAGLSFQDLHGTLIHLIGGELTWLKRFTGVLAVPTNREQAPDLASLFKIRDEAEAGLVAYFAQLAEAAVNADHSYTMPNGNSVTQKLGYLMGHYVNHAQQYRAEAAVRLTELDLSPGSIDMLMFQNSRGS